MRASMKPSKPHHRALFWWAIALVGLALLALSGRVQAQYQAQTVSPAYLHAGPVEAFPVVAAVPAGQWVRLDGCLPDWSWCQVAWNNVVGWAPGLQVGVDAQGWVRTTRSVYWFNGPPIVPFYIHRHQAGTRSSMISQPQPFVLRPTSPMQQGEQIDRTPRTTPVLVMPPAW